MSEKVPDGWKKDTLGNLCSSIRGVSYKPEDLRNEKSTQTVTLLRSNNIQEGGIDFNNVQYVGINKVKQKQIMTDGDIAVCMSNGSKRLVGKSATLQNHIISETFTVGAFCSIIRATEKSSHQFVRHLLKSDDYKQQVEFSLAGSAINNLKDGDVENYTFLLPPLPEQKKIASILTSVDDVIENTQKQIDKLRDLKKATMNELFTKGIGHTEFKDSELGRIPKSWEVCRLGDLLKEIPSYGANASATNNDFATIRYIRITDINEYGQLRSDSTAFIKDSDAEGYLLANDDLLIARTGNTVGKSYLHESGKYNSTTRFAYAGYLIRFRFNNERAIPKYIFQYTLSKFFKGWVKENSRVGAQPNINAQEYSSFVLPLPNLEEQNSIVSILLSIDEQKQSLYKKLAQTQSLKKSLMQDLLTGKVRVQVN